MPTIPLYLYIKSTSDALPPGREDISPSTAEKLLALRKRLVEKEQEAIREQIREQERLERELEFAFNKAMGIEDVREEAEAIAEPFISEGIADSPAGLQEFQPQIDFGALSKDVEATRAMLALLDERRLDDEVMTLLLLSS